MSAIGYRAPISALATAALGRYPPTADPAPAQDQGQPALAQLPLRQTLHDLAQA